ncbi:HAD family hydrolase [Prolixibacteraceae bacterium Z1-6]|uniref:HAD family hydrolase n=1 Tax=Draconibacterium aestuarii TaxID=2998507 RepID=A0A9X3F463_9BACT|nr:HAD family hydrolase [Prolixibacteraceae bacterium Z1-6]
MKNNFKVIAFDADDTLWVNETFFRETEEQFCELLADFSTSEEIMKELFATEIRNLEEYGYGTKGFVLSMIETALKITDNRVPQPTLEKIIKLGKTQINQPVELLEGVVDILEYLTQKGYKLIVATKGDLLDQERKLKKSHLENFFHHVEVMSNKNKADYRKLLKHLDIAPEDFLMIGNSYKSDIEPVLEIGGFGIHIPFHVTWEHEKATENEEHPNWIKMDSVSKLRSVL